ncbi:MAG: two-component system alkaline phosphatase synthesis response regulator PhoP [Psychromonas sp.]|jgi:two-component system alkaline phosphatase synthesis response regulator PhoP
MSKRILIVDDEKDIRDILEYNLKKEGFEVRTAENGLKGFDISKSFKPDLILLDVMMPEMDGMEMCEALRNTPGFEQTYICFLTARSEDYSQVAGLDTGADDYITKPIKTRVLISRINAMFRRNRVEEAQEIESDLIINREKYILIKAGENIHLPKKEFELLSLLMSKPDTVFERDYIMEMVWGTEIIVGDRTIDVHIRKLREKIGDHYIKTIKGVGYKFLPV